MNYSLQKATGDFLIWLAQHTSYHTTVIFKESVGDFFSLFAGFTIAFIVYVYLVKDARLMIDQNTEHIFLTRLKKNGHTRIYITLPPQKGNHLKLIMTIALFFNVILVRILPIKQIKFVNKYTIYIVFWIIIFLIFAFFIIAQAIAFHVFLPDGKGGYLIE